MSESEELKSLNHFVENENGKAQSKIYELRGRITALEKEIRYYEGKKEMTECILGEIQEKGEG